jgi:hypothetical protein
MKRSYWLELVPSLIVGVAIVLSTLVAVRAARYGWMAAAGPLLLATAVVCADVLARRLRGEASRPSPAGLILSVAISVAGFLLIALNARSGDTSIAWLGTACWAALLSQSKRPRTACRAI